MQQGSIDLGKVAISPKGAYSSTAIYERLDCVTAGNGTYLSLKDGNTGHAVSESSWWLCLVTGQQAVDAAQAANEAAQNALNKANSAHTAAGNANNQAAAASAAAQAVNAVVAQAESAVEDAQEAAEECRQVIASASQVESLGLIPTAMSVEYPDTITLGNPSDRYIKPIFTPSHVIPNVIYLGDDKAVSVAPNGRITVNDEGESVVHVVPTNKTALYKTIRIKVKRAGLRLVNARTSLRLTANRNLRLN